MPRSKVQSERMRAEGRDRILTAARHLFAERGYDGCTVSDIAAQAGMSQGNIYWYFASKEDLLKASLADAFDSLRALFDEIAAYPGTAAEKVDRLIARYIALGRERGGAEAAMIIYSLTVRGGIGRLRDLGFDMAQIGPGLHRSLATLFGQAQAEGALAPGADPNLLAMFFLSFFNGLAVTYREEAGNVPRDAMRAAVLRLLGERAG